MGAARKLVIWDVDASSVMVRLTAAAFRALNRRQKYGAKATVVDGIKFASRKEARRYRELKLLERAGEIRELTVQPRFPLFTISADDRRVPIVSRAGRIYEYRGDFSYYDKSGTFHAEDVKSAGTLLPLSKLKIAILQASTGLTVELVGL